MQLTYTDPQGRVWTLRDVTASPLSGFITAVRDDGQRVHLYYYGNHNLRLCPLNQVQNAS